MSVVYWAELQGAGRRLGRLADRGAFGTGTHYFAGDIVTHSGTTYVAIAERAPGGPTPGSAPDTWGALSDVFGNVPLPPPAAPPHLTPGVTRLLGPYIVDYTDIPHDGDTKTLWTPQVGDVLLRLVVDESTVVLWNHGQLFVGQGVDGTGSPLRNSIGQGVSFSSGGSPDDAWSGIDPAFCGTYFDSAGHQHSPTAFFFHSTDPFQLQLAQTGGTDPTAGHVEMYALVARALPVS